MNPEESRQKQYPKNYPYQEDEINLIDHFRVLWKWKWLIIGGTLTFAVVAWIISFVIPETYRVTVVIEPGIMDPEHISGKVNEGGYNLKTGFKADVGKHANLIKISTECNEKEIDLGVRSSQKLIALISDEGKEVVRKRNDDSSRQILAKQNEIEKVKTRWERNADQQIKYKQNGMETKRNQIKLEQVTLKTVRQRIEELKPEIEKIKDNVEEMMKRREILLKGNDVNDDLFLRYATLIQQKMAYSTQLSNQIYSLKMIVQEKEINIADLNSDISIIKKELEEFQLRTKDASQDKIDEIKKEVKELTSEKEKFRNIKVVQNPKVSPDPVTSKRKQFILLVTVVSFLLLILLSHFIQYLKNYKIN